ncbi:MAG: potassium channel family protein [Candidatus Micrarchaeota archaeon]|nr:potassium channel family protein [Candidatus Micrarchaeota archaeon]
MFEKIDKRLLVPVVILIILYAIGIFAYTHLERWSVADSIYFLTMTFTTIGGYGNLIPQTQTGRMVTVAFCYSGVAVALYTFSILADLMSKHDEVNRARIDKIRHHMTRIPFTKRKAE